MSRRPPRQAGARRLWHDWRRRCRTTRRRARRALRRCRAGAASASRSRQRREQALARAAACRRAAPLQSGSVVSTAASMSLTVSPSKSRRPVSISKSSDAEGPDVGALVDGAAARLLGRHVGGGAEDRAPPRCRCARASATATGRTIDVGARSSPVHAFARPKSSTLTVPSGVSFTFAGFRSRCTMPFS